MEKRRQRILQEARRMLAHGGFDALNLRDLAEISGVTVPTVYNLIGNKAEILRALVLDAFAEYESEMEKQAPAVEQLPCVMVSTFARLLKRDEAYYRATGLANERVELEDQENYGFKRVPLRRYAHHLYDRALDEGLLLGQIDGDLLVEQMISTHQMAFRDWVHRVISLSDLKRRTLSGFYIALSADAHSDYRHRLVDKLKALA
jgi:AcrR family transcriptional regulator